jgi:hypothetical protein
MLNINGISGLGHLGYGPRGLAHFNAPAMNAGIVTGATGARASAGAPPSADFMPSPGMSTRKKILIGLAVLLPVGYVAHRFMKRRGGGS